MVLLLILFTVNIIQDYFKKEAHNFLGTTYLLLYYTRIQASCEKNTLKLLNKMLEKYLRKIFFEIAGAKNEFIQKYFSRFLIKI